MNFQDELIDHLRNCKRSFGAYVVEHGDNKTSAKAYGYADKGDDVLRIDIQFPSDTAQLSLYSSAAPGKALETTTCEKEVYTVARSVFDMIDMHGTLADYDDFEEDDSLPDDERIEQHHESIDTFLENVNKRVNP